MIIAVRVGGAVAAAISVLALLAGVQTVGGSTAEGQEGPGLQQSASDADAVNSGRKKQAVGLKMRRAERVEDGVAGPYGRYGGCIPGYGRGRACLPPAVSDGARAGSTSADGCAYVRRLLPRGIRLDAPGRDPLRLDSDGDGTACGEGNG